MNRNNAGRYEIPLVLAENNRSNRKQNRRQDWGYTDQYRRMIKRDNPKKSGTGNED